jgi:lipopolysaccharide export system permease protein
MAFGRLMADNEINALRTSGVPFKRIVRLPLVLGLVMFATSYWINENVVPKSTDLSTRTFYQIVYKTQSLPIEPNLFRVDPATNNTFYVGSVDADNRTMHDIKIFKPGRTTQIQEIVTAKTGSLRDAELILLQPTIMHFKPSGEVDGDVISPKTMSVGLPLAETAENFLSSAYNDPYTMDSKQLSNDIKVRKATGQGGSDLAKREISLAQKLSYPFASFIAVLIALPLAVRFGKRGRALGIALSLVTMFVYWALESIALAFGRNNTIDPYVAAWIPNVVMAFAGGYLIFSEDR